MLAGSPSYTASSPRLKVPIHAVLPRVILMMLCLGLELEDIDHIFERGGITGGVWETRGKTVERRRIAKDVEEIERHDGDVKVNDVEKT